MLDKFFSTKLYINFNSLKKNLSYFEKKLPLSTELIAVLKANAYGFGDVKIAKELVKTGIKYIAVADFEEGIRLRKHGIKIPVMIMYPGLNNLKSIIANDLEPTIYSLPMLNKLILESKKTKKYIYFHLKIDSGMKRYGLEDTELITVAKKIKKHKKLRIKSIFSHLASSNQNKDKEFTVHQINKLKSQKLALETIISYDIKSHILNSHGVLNFLDSHFDMARIGFGLYYGINDKNTRCIAELKSSISQIKNIKKGDSVGYNRAFISKRKMKIGIIPIGYADGLKRSWGNGKLSFFRQNNYLPIIGNISMDSCIIDITKLKNIKEGDEVVLFGHTRSIFELSKQLETIPYEITAGLSKRIRRVYI